MVAEKDGDRAEEGAGTRTNLRVKALAQVVDVAAVEVLGKIVDASFSLDTSSFDFN